MSFGVRSAVKYTLFRMPKRQAYEEIAHRMYT